MVLFMLTKAAWHVRWESLAFVLDVWDQRSVWPQVSIPQGFHLLSQH